MKRFVIALALILVTWYGYSLLVTAVEPTVASDIALAQMNDTTEAHVVTRGYLNQGQNSVRSMGLPIAISMIIVWVAFGAQIKQSFNSTEEEEKAGVEA
jgi:hypothetical protein